MPESHIDVKSGRIISKNTISYDPRELGDLCNVEQNDSGKFAKIGKLAIKAEKDGIWILNNGEKRKLGYDIRPIRISSTNREETLGILDNNGKLFVFDVNKRRMIKIDKKIDEKVIDFISPRNSPFALVTLSKGNVLRLFDLDYHVVLERKLDTTFKLSYLIDSLKPGSLIVSSDMEIEEHREKYEVEHYNYKLEKIAEQTYEFSDKYEENFFGQQAYPEIKAAVPKDGKLRFGFWLHRNNFEPVENTFLENPEKKFGSGVRYTDIFKDENIIIGQYDYWYIGWATGTGYSYETGIAAWDLETGKRVDSLNLQLPSSDSPYISRAVSSRRIVVGDHEGTLELMDFERPRQPVWAVRRAHFSGISHVAKLDGGKTIATLGDDAAISFWNAETGTKISTLYLLPEGGWNLITPVGFFAASANGNDVLSIVRGLEVTNVEQIHQSLYSPDLVGEKLAGDPDKEFEKAAKVINLEKVLDSGQVPEVEISAPIAAETKVDLFDAEARIIDAGGGIGRVEWRVNGITAGVETPPRGTGGTITVKRRLALDRGENTIEVVAYNGRNLLASLPQRTTIKWQGAAQAGKGRLFVLAIGIDAYNDANFRRLKLAVKDAKSFGAALEAAGKGEYASAHLTSALDGDATPDNLDKLVNDIASKITPRDTFILFAAAHGTSKNGHFYLIPYGYDSNAPGTLAEKAVGQDKLQDWVANRIKARKALILLDTCESGALVGGYTTSRVDVPASEAAVGRLHEATGRPVLTATASGKAALEGYKGHGVFTWALLDALRNGDTSGNGVIELSELAAHVQGLVPKLTAEMRSRGTSETDKRAAFTVPVPEAAAPYSTFRQSARFGSRGENFTIARQLQ